MVGAEARVRVTILSRLFAVCVVGDAVMPDETVILQFVLASSAAPTTVKVSCALLVPDCAEVMSKVVGAQVQPDSFILAAKVKSGNRTEMESPTAKLKLVSKT